MADCRDLDEVLAATVDDAVRADDELTDVVAPELGDHASRVREAAQGSDLLEQLLEPAARGSRIVGGDVDENLIDLFVSARRPDQLHFR